MNKTVINVPKGIEFLSEWKEFSLPSFPVILNKQITGCGFTEFCLTCNSNIILCSPRRILLENKEDNYKKRVEKFGKQSYELFYARNDFEKQTNFDKDLTATKKSRGIPQVDNISKEFTIEFKNRVKEFYHYCNTNRQYCKILVTYDSFRKVKESLEELGVFNQFYVVIDEFQSIFTDSRFKSNAELEFVSALQGYDKICYASATPMIEEYLDQLDEFKDLPYCQLDWEAEDPSRVMRPKINTTSCARLLRKAYEIISKYKTNGWRDSDNNSKKFIDSSGNIQEIQSKEAVFYMNSVKNICSIIRNCQLKQEECNILCAKTEENKEKIRKAFGVTKAEFKGLGKVYTEDEMQNNKMFTFCTRTVYLGADFYSTCARSFIFSDANSKTMAVDITLDLPQILGRQRLGENPWKNEAEVYYSSTNDSNKQTRGKFTEFLQQKIKKTEDLLSAYETSISDSVKLSLSDNYEKVAATFNYESDYVSINKHTGKLPIPVLNKLVMLSEIREFEIRQIDYADRFSVKAKINSDFGIVNNQIVEDILMEFENKKFFQEKMKYLCESIKDLDKEIQNEILYKIDDYYSNYYVTLGPEKIISLSFRRDRLELELKKTINNQYVDPSIQIYQKFHEGEKHSNKSIKEVLKDLYNIIGLQKVPKASDIEEWFETKTIKLKDSTGKWIHGIELLKKKK